MAWKAINVNEEIEKRRSDDADFKKAWDSSREEYRIIGEIIMLRKEKGLSQSALADEVGIKQQVISRIETKENSPSLKTICALLAAMDYQIVITPRQV